MPSVNVRPFPVGYTVTAGFLNNLVGVLDRSNGTVSAANTTSEITLYSFPVAGGVLLDDRCLHLEMAGTLAQTGVSNGTADATIRLKYGVSTVLQLHTVGMNSGGTYHWVADWRLQGDGASNAQKTSGNIRLSNPPTNAIGEFSFVNTGSSVVDSTVNNTLTVTVQWNIASAGVTFTKTRGTLALL